jgi:hypothetical protein
MLAYDTAFHACGPAAEGTKPENIVCFGRREWWIKIIVTVGPTLAAGKPPR